VDSPTFYGACRATFGSADHRPSRADSVKDLAKLHGLLKIN
jgi:hypothetical protein